MFYKGDRIRITKNGSKGTVVFVDSDNRVVFTEDSPRRLCTASMDIVELDIPHIKVKENEVLSYFGWSE